MVAPWTPMSISKCARVLRLAVNRVFLQKYSLKLQMISKQIERIKLPCEPTYVFDVNKYPPNSNTFYSFLSHRLPLYTSSLERSNIIIIITCSFVIVFIACDHLYLSMGRYWNAHVLERRFSLINSSHLYSTKPSYR